MKKYNTSASNIEQSINDAIDALDITQLIQEIKETENPLVFFDKLVDSLRNSQNILSSAVVVENEYIEVHLEHEQELCEMYSDALYDFVVCKVPATEVNEVYDSFKKPSYEGEKEDAIYNAFYLIKGLI